MSRQGGPSLHYSKLPSSHSLRLADGPLSLKCVSKIAYSLNPPKFGLYFTKDIFHFIQEFVGV